MSSALDMLEKSNLSKDFAIELINDNIEIPISNFKIDMNYFQEEKFPPETVNNKGTQSTINQSNGKTESEEIIIASGSNIHSVSSGLNNLGTSNTKGNNNINNDLGSNKIHICRSVLFEGS
jgi:hypothetical protein